MRATAILATTATFISHAAVADVKRREFIPESLRGSWAPTTEVCKNADKSIIAISAKTYTSSEANCTVVWVSETAAARGPIYSAHLQCVSRMGGPQTLSNLILRQNGTDQISVGADFPSLKAFWRCAADESTTKR